jgi:hypothetical protein
VHDFFEVLGLPSNAAGGAVRRACARRVHRAHPDFSEPPVERSDRSLCGAIRAARGDVAIDFVDAGTLVERIQTAFFISPR